MPLTNNQLQSYLLPFPISYLKESLKCLPVLRQKETKLKKLIYPLLPISSNEIKSNLSIGKKYIRYLILHHFSYTTFESKKVMVRTLITHHVVCSTSIQRSIQVSTDLLQIRETLKLPQTSILSGIGTTDSYPNDSFPTNFPPVDISTFPTLWL